MIRAKDIETMANKLSNLGLPFEDFMTLLQIDKDAREFSFNIVDASNIENAVYRFCFNKEESGEYVIHDYEAKMLVVPIEHGKYAGIDTLALENDMKQVNWSLFPMYNKDDLIHIFEMLDHLRHRGDEASKSIGKKLAIKYFSNTPLEGMLPLPDKSPYENTITIPLNNNGNDIDIRQAVQLLNGETILKYSNYIDNSDELFWLKEEKGYLKVYPDFDLSKTIKEMPLVKQPDIIELSEMLAGLGNGKPFETALMINSRIVTGSIHVQPKNKTLEFRNDKGKTVNWQLWNKLKQNKKPGKGKKGPGL